MYPLPPNPAIQFVPASSSSNPNLPVAINQLTLPFTPRQIYYPMFLEQISNSQLASGQRPPRSAINHPMTTRFGTQTIDIGKLSAAIFTAPTRLETLNMELSFWENEAPCDTEKIQRKEASTKIRNAFSEDSMTLLLDGLNLTSLPNCLHKLTCLRQLQISNNKLRELPELPASLVVLWTNNNYFPRAVAVDPDEITILDKKNVTGLIFPADKTLVL